MGSFLSTAMNPKRWLGVNFAESGDKGTTVFGNTHEQTHVVFQTCFMWFQKQKEHVSSGAWLGQGRWFLLWFHIYNTYRHTKLDKINFNKTTSMDIICGSRFGSVGLLELSFGAPILNFNGMLVRKLEITIYLPVDCPKRTPLLKSCIRPLFLYSAICLWLPKVRHSITSINNFTFDLN